MQEAMDKVKKELGHSAVILSTKEVRTKGFLGFFRKKQIEIIAAVDPNPIQIKKPTLNEKQRITKPKQQSVKLNQRPIVENVLKEHKLTLNNTSTLQPDQFLPKEVQSLLDELLDQEINENVVKELTPILLESFYTNKLSKEQLKNEAKNYFFSKLSQVQPLEINEAKHIFLVGPTGVGKTTSIAKLAAKSAIAQGKKVAFITLDTYRIAAIEQLKTYAKILNVPLEVAYNKDDFLNAKMKLKDYDQIFIDTAGRNYRNDEFVKQLGNLIEYDENDIFLCALSLTSKERDLKEILLNFSKLSLSGVIFTKADETVQYGQIYNLINELNLRPSYITYGQDVPDDIELLTPKLISDLLVGERKW